jgi:hypothetical protein
LIASFIFQRILNLYSFKIEVNKAKEKWQNMLIMLLVRVKNTECPDERYPK